jgi:hypothetical protein
MYVLCFLLHGTSLCIFPSIHPTYRPNFNKPPLDTYIFAIQGNKCTYAICWILHFDLMDKVNRQSWKKHVNQRILYRIRINMMTLAVYIDRHHCYNKEVVSVETHLNFYYLHESFIPFLFLFLLIAGDMSINTFICYFHRHKTSWN